LLRIKLELKAVRCKIIVDLLVANQTWIESCKM
jgi:hypothetical protein